LLLCLNLTFTFICISFIPLTVAWINLTAPTFVLTLAQVLCVYHGLNLLVPTSSIHIHLRSIARDSVFFIRVREHYPCVWETRTAVRVHMLLRLHSASRFGEYRKWVFHMFSSAQFLRNWREQRSSNKGDLHSSSTEVDLLLV
jgi:hypothetical protein